MLFNLTCAAPQPWIDKGYVVVSCDIQHPYTVQWCTGYNHLQTNLGAGTWRLNKLLEDYGLEPALVLSFAPCTDLAVSGAAHFARKRRANPEFQNEATRLAKLAEGYGVPYMLENPVSVLATLWRKPNVYFHPCDYGGYLPEDDIDPLYPDVLPPQDAYHKKTCLWTGNGFTMPTPKPVAPLGKEFPGHTKLGGKSIRTKNIRSATPRGLAQGIFEANRHLLD